MEAKKRLEKEYEYVSHAFIKAMDLLLEKESECNALKKENEDLKNKLLTKRENKKDKND